MKTQKQTASRENNTRNISRGTKFPGKKLQWLIYLKEKELVTLNKDSSDVAGCKNRSVSQRFILSSSQQLQGIFISNLSHIEQIILEIHIFIHYSTSTVYLKY